MLKVNQKKREIIDVIRTVAETFGFSEIEKTDSLYDDLKKEPGKYYFFKKDTVTAVNSIDVENAAKADLISLGVEIALICEKEEVRISVNDKNLAQLLGVFGFENITDIKEDEDIALKSMGKSFLTANFNSEFCETTLNFSEFFDEDFEDGAKKSLIFAEKNAEGYAYEISYNLRMNGCIVEYYTGNGGFDDAVSYANKKEIGCVLRSFSDGKLMINDFVKNEIIETTVDDFLGYYEEDECDCGCGAEEHHHHHKHE